MNSPGITLYAEDDANDAFFMQIAFEELKRESSLRIVPNGKKAIEYLAGEGVYANREKFPLPAILILGFDLELTRVMLVALLGALLGILMMIPLRRALIVKEHHTLKYPEGTACAAVLKAGANLEDRAAASAEAQAEMRALAAAGAGAAPGARVIFGGFGIGLVYTTLNLAFRAWKDVAEKVFGPPFKAGSVSVEVSPALLGVGYIIGPRIAAIM